MKPHPLSQLFPPMSNRALNELAADIKANGLHSPIVCHEGMILDGAQRERACEIANEPPEYVDLMDLSPALWRNGPLAFVISENLHRRHLTSDTQKELHKKLVPLIEAELQERAAKATSLASESKIARKHRRTGNKASGKPTQHRTEAVKQAAAMTGSSEATVYRNISRGNGQQKKVKPTRTITQPELHDPISELIESARLNNGTFRARFDDYIVTITYSPTKPTPAIKKFTSTACS